jgi:hypothetical protein
VLRGGARQHRGGEAGVTTGEGYGDGGGYGDGSGDGSE